MKDLIVEVWNNRELLKDKKYSDAVRAVIEEVDKGRLRVASPTANGPQGSVSWQVNEWVKQAILMYFAIQPMQTWDIAPFEFYDKMLLKKKLCSAWSSCRTTCGGPVWRLPCNECRADAFLCQHWRLCR